MEIKPKKIESIQYVGSVSHFRAWMDRFLSLGRGRMFFPFPDNERDLILKQTVEENNKAIRDSEPYRIIFDMSLWSWQLHIRYSEKDKDANREVWYVHLYDPTVSKTTFVPDKRASILAVEQSPNNTIVEFLDGVTFRNGLLTSFPYEGMIGDMFSNYTKFIKDEWEGKTKILDQKLHADDKTNENESSSGDVFISYSHKDKEYAHELAIEFERYLLKPWIDEIGRASCRERV